MHSISLLNVNVIIIIINSNNKYGVDVLKSLMTLRNRGMKTTLVIIKQVQYFYFVLILLKEDMISHFIELQLYDLNAYKKKKITTC